MSANPAYYAALTVAGEFATDAEREQEFDYVPELHPEPEGGWSFPWQYADGRTYTVTIREAS